MVAHHAPVLNHDLARRLRLLRCLIVANSKLHPDDLRGSLDRLVHDRWYVGGRTEDVDGVERNWPGVEGRIRFLPEDLGRRRVHRDDPVAVHLHVLRDAMRVLRWVLRAADDRDRLDITQDSPDLRVVDHWSTISKACLPVKVSEGGRVESRPSDSARDSDAPLRLERTTGSPSARRSRSAPRLSIV